MPIERPKECFTLESQKLVQKSCCGGISLKNGTIITGVVWLIGAFLAVVVIGIMSTDAVGPMDLTSYMVKRVVTGICIINYLVHGIFAALMVHGAIKRIPAYIVPWMAMNFASIIGYMSLFLSITYVSVGLVSIGRFFLFLFLGSTILSLEIYAWLIVYSHYKEINANKHDHQTCLSDDRTVNPPHLQPLNDV